MQLFFGLTFCLQAHYSIVRSTMEVTVVTSLYKCARFLEGYFDSLERIQGTEDLEVLLIHNAPTDEELKIVTERVGAHRWKAVRHVIVENRENLYASWNRAARMASGQYIAVWNVDDAREPDSILRQVNSLKANPNAMLSYGDIVGVPAYGDQEGRHYYHPEYQPRKGKFMRGFYSSCFPMWRREVHDQIGYFDEQFTIVGDFDFQVRLVNRFPLVKTEGLLGYYLEGDSQKLSSAAEKLDIERTAIELRYGQFDKVNLLYVSSALRNIELRYLHWNGERHFLPDYFEDYRQFIANRLALWPGSIFRLPTNAIRFLRRRFLRS